VRAAAIEAVASSRAFRSMIAAASLKQVPFGFDPVQTPAAFGSMIAAASLKPG